MLQPPLYYFPLKDFPGGLKTLRGVKKKGGRCVHRAALTVLKNA